MQNLSSCYHSSHRQLLTRSKQEGTRTNDGVRADAQVLPLPQLLSTRRIGLAHRILLHGPAWLHGLIQSTDDGSKGWTRALKHDPEWLDSFEPGAFSTFKDLVQSLFTTSRNALKAMVKRAKTVAILFQASQDDLTSLETFQQEAFGSIGIPIGLQEPQHLYTCEKCDKTFVDKQALRTHQSKVHTVLAIANLYLGNASFCLACRRECFTRNHLRRHLQGQKTIQCIRTIAFWFPDPTGQKNVPSIKAFQILYADTTGNRLKHVPNTTRLDPGSRRQARHG